MCIDVVLILLQMVACMPLKNPSSQLLGQLTSKYLNIKYKCVYLFLSLFAYGLKD